MAHPTQTSPNEPHWLDKHIAEQAAHYGMTIEAKAKLFGGASKYDELIESGQVDDPRHQ